MQPDQSIDMESRSPLKVGDRIRVVDGYYREFIGMEGTITRVIWESDFRYGYGTDLMNRLTGCMQIFHESLVEPV